MFLKVRISVLEKKKKKKGYYVLKLFFSGVF